MKSQHGSGLNRQRCPARNDDRFHNIVNPASENQPAIVLGFCRQRSGVPEEIARPAVDLFRIVLSQDSIITAHLEPEPAGPIERYTAPKNRPVATIQIVKSATTCRIPAALVNERLFLAWIIQKQAREKSR